MNAGAMYLKSKQMHPNIFSILGETAMKAKIGALFQKLKNVSDDCDQPIDEVGRGDNQGAEEIWGD